MFLSPWSPWLRAYHFTHFVDIFSKAVGLIRSTAEQFRFSKVAFRGHLPHPAQALTPGEGALVFGGCAVSCVSWDQGICVLYQLFPVQF